MRSPNILSIIAGLVGGSLGYGIGAWFQITWLSVVLFFCLGYIGYDFRRLLSVSWMVAEQTLDLMFELIRAFVYSLDELRRFFHEMLNPRAYLTLPLFVLFWGMGFAFLNDGVRIAGALDWMLHWPSYIMANVEWSRETGDSFTFYFWLIVMTIPAFAAYCVSGWMLQIFMPVIKLIGVLLATLIMSPLATYRLCRTSPEGFLLPFYKMYDLYVFIDKDLMPVAKQYAPLVPLVMLWTLFCLIVGPVILLIKGLTLILIGIHSARRLAMALTTTAGGIAYMLMVPFPSELVPIALASIVCGLFCGLSCLVVALILDGEPRRAMFWAFVRRPILSMAPLYKS